MKALLLIDIQNDFLPGGNLAVPQGDLIIPVVNKIQNNFDLVVATQDWHPPTHQSFACQHSGKNTFEKINLRGLEQVLWPEHCIQGTYGADFSGQLHMNKVEAIFRKGTESEIDSYSGFYDNGRRKSTGLADYLRGRGVRQLYLAGLAADFCVFYSAIDAIREGFQIFFIEDATKPIDAEVFEEAKIEIAGSGGKIIQSAVI